MPDEDLVPTDESKPKGDRDLAALVRAVRRCVPGTSFDADPELEAIADDLSLVATLCEAFTQEQIQALDARGHEVVWGEDAEDPTTIGGIVEMVCMARFHVGTVAALPALEQLTEDLGYVEFMCRELTDEQVNALPEVST